MRWRYEVEVCMRYEVEVRGEEEQEHTHIVTSYSITS